LSRATRCGSGFTRQRREGIPSRLEAGRNERHRQRCIRSPAAPCCARPNRQKGDSNSFQLETGRNEGAPDIGRPWTGFGCPDPLSVYIAEPRPRKYWPLSALSALSVQLSRCSSRDRPCADGVQLPDHHAVELVLVAPARQFQTIHAGSGPDQSLDLPRIRLPTSSACEDGPRLAWLVCTRCACSTTRQGMYPIYRDVLTKPSDRFIMKHGNVQ